jgi:membrane protease subunit HflC
MQAYEAGLRHTDTRFLLKPDTSFFRYFNNPTGKLGAETALPPAAPAR